MRFLKTSLARGFLAAAKAAYGKRWQAALSHATGLSPALLSMIKSAERDVTPEVEASLVKALEGERKRLQTAALKVSVLIERIKADLP